MVTAKPCQIEGSSSVTGTYVLEPNVQYTPIGEDKTRATLPLSVANRFFRLRLDYP